MYDQAAYKKSNPEPIANPAYDRLADSYAARVGTKPYNADYERPALLSLLPEVKGLRVLDAGCGPGLLTEILVGKGASVVAMDANAKMVAHARERLGNRAEVLQASLEAPLDFCADASFDLAVSSLVMHYIFNWQATFRELYRILKPGGGLIFSIEHPVMTYLDHYKTSVYFATEQIEYTWRGFGEPVVVPSYRRPLAEVFNPIIEAGFRLEQVLEPLPTEKFKEKNPEDYQKLHREPGFMFICAARQP